MPITWKKVFNAFFQQSCPSIQIQGVFRWFLALSQPEVAEFQGVSGGFCDSLNVILCYKKTEVL